MSAEERARYTNCKYDLVSNVVHEGGVSEDEGSVYKTRVYHKGLSEWLEMEDHHVAEIDRGTEHSRVFVTPSYIQVWERKGAVVADEGMHAHHLPFFVPIRWEQCTIFCYLRKGGRGRGNKILFEFDAF